MMLIPRIKNLNVYLLELLKRAAPYIEEQSLFEHVTEYLSGASSWSYSHDFYKRFYYVDPYSRYVAWCVWYRTPSAPQIYDQAHLDQFEEGIRKLELMVQAREALFTREPVLDPLPLGVRG